MSTLYEYSALHTHDVLDDDFHFAINANTREIVNTDDSEILLVQHDHNSERCTFVVPKMIDGHDMTECNVVRVHFINISSEDQNLISKGLYDVPMTEFKAYDKDASKLVFSWLISKTATEYVGTISFLIEFMCTDGDKTIYYSWHTGVYTGGIVQRGINNTDVIIGEYYDVLDTWVKLIEEEGKRVRSELVVSVENDSKAILDSHTDKLKSDITSHAIATPSVEGIIVQETGNSETKVMSQDCVTKEINRVDSTIVEVRAEVNSVKDSVGELAFDKSRAYLEISPTNESGLNIYPITGGKTYLVKPSKPRDGWGFKVCTRTIVYTDNDGSTQRDELKHDITPNKTYYYDGKYIPVRILDDKEYSESNGEHTTKYVESVIEVDGVRSVQRVEYASGKFVYTTFQYATYCITGCEQVLELNDPAELSTYKVEANGITSITRTNSSVVNGVPTNTYTILLDDGQTTTFDVKDGVGISNISKITSGTYEDTYGIELTNGNEIYFKVPSSTVYTHLLARVTTLEQKLGISSGVTTVKLSTPENVRFLSTGNVLWNYVHNATGYVYRIYSSDGEYVEYMLGPTENMTDKALTNGQSISVKATGDGILYSDSNWSNRITFNAKEEPDTPDTPDTPVTPDTPASVTSVYYGVGTVEGDAITESFIKGLTAKESKSRACSFTVSPATQYVYFAAPKSYCVDGSGNNVTKFSVGGIDQTGTFTSPQLVPIGGVEYYVYRSVYTLNWNNLSINVT